MDHILFDMDGLLLDTERLYMEAFEHACRELGHGDRMDVFFDCLGKNTKTSAPIMQAAFPEPGALAAFNVIWDKRIAELMAVGIRHRPGAQDLLSMLAAQGKRLAVATSTNTQRARHHLEDTGLLQFFETVTGGDQVTHGKPDPEVYHRAAASLGTTADLCIAFEDSDTGTRAAVASGARVVQVPDLAQPSAEVRAFGHHIAPSLLAGAAHVGLIEA